MTHWCMAHIWFENEFLVLTWNLFVNSIDDRIVDHIVNSTLVNDYANIRDSLKIVFGRWFRRIAYALYIGHFLFPCNHCPNWHESSLIWILIIPDIMITVFRDFLFFLFLIHRKILVDIIIVPEINRPFNIHEEMY